MHGALAIDIGGTKVDVGVVDETGRVESRRRIATGAHPEATALIDSVVSAAGEVLAGTGLDLIEPCGIGCGGPMTPGGGRVSPLNIPVWRDFPLRDEIETRLGRPAVIDNDAKALALAEGWLGGARGKRNYLAMVVSTGIGAGLVVDGRLLEGEESNAGHLGHVVVEPGGRECSCGARGCLEAEASGTAIAAITRAPAESAGPQVRKRVGGLVGRAVASTFNLLDLPLALAAGSVALGFGAPFFSAAQAEIDRLATIGSARRGRIVPAALGADGPLIGAAALARAAAGLPVRNVVGP